MVCESGEAGTALRPVAGHGQRAAARSAIAQGRAACAATRDKTGADLPSLRAEDAALTAWQARLTETPAERAQLAKQAADPLQKVLTEQPSMKPDLEPVLGTAQQLTRAG